MFLLAVSSGGSFFVMLQKTHADAIADENTAAHHAQFTELESQHAELLEKLSCLTEDYESVMQKLADQSDANKSLAEEYEQVLLSV